VDRIIKKLIEADKQSRQLVEEAKKSYGRLVEQIEQESDEYKQGFVKKAEMRIQKAVAAQQELFDEAVENIKRRNSKIIDEIELLYLNNHEKWEDEIYKNCIF